MTRPPIIGRVGDPPTEYLCSKGHYQSRPAGQPALTKCQAYVHGSPCRGELKRIGHGSRKAAKTSV